MLEPNTDSYSKISRVFLGKHPVGGLPRDRIVDNIRLYWLAFTGASAAALTTPRRSRSQHHA